MLGYIGLYPGSFAFYCLLVLLCCLLARIAEERDARWPLVVAVIVLTVVSGIRAPSVGVDTAAYVHAYGVETPSYFEPGFKLLIEVLRPLDSNAVFLGVVALVMYGCVMGRLWQLRGRVGLALPVAVFMLVYFSTTWNGLRSCLATSIMFYGTSYIEKRSYPKFFALLLLCCTIHYSSVVFSALLLGGLFRGRHKNNVLAYAGYLFLLAASIGLFAWMSQQGLFDRYSEGYSNDGYSSRLGLSWSLFFALVVAVLYFMRGDEGGFDDRVFSKSIACYVLIGVALAVSGLFWVAGGRLSSYFLIYSTVLFPYGWKLSRSHKHGVFYRFGLVVYCCYAFFQVLSVNGQSLMPYVVG